MNASQTRLPSVEDDDIARLVSEIEACDREIGLLNATSALGLGYIPLVLSGAAPAIRALFQDGAVWDVFIAVAGSKRSTRLRCYGP
jgi:hypothetical protein